MYADYIIILGGSVHTIKENAKALVVARKEIGLEVNADKIRTWSFLDIRIQDEVPIQTDNKAFEKGNNSNIGEKT